MKFVIPGVACFFLGCSGAAQAEPRVFPAEHCQIEPSSDWHEVTKSDELFSVENANQDSLTIQAIHAGKPMDVQHSTMVADLEATFRKKNYKILKDGSFTFQQQPAVFVLANGGKLGFTFNIYVIFIADGNDVLCFTMVADNDPSQDAQYKALLDSFALIPAPPTATTPPSPP